MIIYNYKFLIAINFLWLTDLLVVVVVSVPIYFVDKLYESEFSEIYYGGYSRRH